MDWSHKLLFAVFLILATAIDTAHADAMVSGTVFCDQCKDGKISLFDYPVSGVKVEVVCTDSNGQVTMKREETTNWVGNYAMKFDGSPNLSQCQARVSDGGQGSVGCGLAAGSAQSFRLMFRMLDLEMYTVDPLLSQPPQPVSRCPGSAKPVPSPANPTPRHASPVPRHPSVPQFKLPPMPRLPPLPPMPRLPFMEASACSHQNWSMPEHRCQWRVLNPDMKAGVVLGTLAARRYGPDVTLKQGLQGRGDPYKTLLREAITALLNSYHSLQFPYHPLDVLQQFNWALMGSRRRVLVTAHRLIRANSGSGAVACKFNRCT